MRSGLGSSARREPGRPLRGGFRRSPCAVAAALVFWPFDGGSDELSGVLAASRARRQPRFQHRDPRQRSLQLTDQRQQRKDQRVLLGNGQLGEVDIRCHPDVEFESPVIASTKFVITPPNRRGIPGGYRGEQLQLRSDITEFAE